MRYKIFSLAIMVCFFTLTVKAQWSLTGNSGTSPGTNYLGTSDGQALLIKTNGVERIHINANGLVGIGTNNPVAALHVNGDIIGSGRIVAGASGFEDSSPLQVNGNASIVGNIIGVSSISNNNYSPYSVLKLPVYGTNGWVFSTPNAAANAGLRRFEIGNGADIVNSTFSNSNVLIANGNLGFGTSNPLARISFPNVSESDNPEGITWSNNPGYALAYGIHRTAGPWTGPDYQQLRLGWGTGIILDPGTQFGKSYVDIQGGGLNVTTINGKGGNLGIGVTNPLAKLSFPDVNASNDPVGITWFNNAAYAQAYSIHRTEGPWTAPDYQQLRLGWGTGIILDPGTQFGKSYVDIQGGGLKVTTVKLSGALMTNNTAGTAGQVLTSAGAGNAPAWTTPSGSSSGWSLTGNSGTNPSINFIGTTDAKDLAFRINNTERLRLSQSGRLITNSPNTSVFIGNNAGNDTYTGYDNVAVGAYTLISGTSGYDNTAVGSNALRYTSTGRDNTGIGTKALMNSQGSISNVNVGSHSGFYTSTGNYNSALGTLSMHYTTSGSENTVVGYFAMRTNTTGSYNTALESGADVGANNLTNATAIGYRAYVTTNNSLVLGSIAGVNGASASTNVGIGTTSPNSNARLDVNGNIFSSGKIAIGTTDMAKIADYSLVVNGEAICNKLRVKLYTNWPDFVLEEKYNLLPIAQLEEYINANKHLPDIPAAAQVAKEGIDVGGNQALLLQKIEELTLYIIEQNKKIELLQKDNTTIKMRLDKSLSIKE